MIFRQLFDHTSSTYTYLLASGVGREALLIDPVLEQTDLYIRLLEELDLKLVKAVDTHCHADHVTALGELRDRTRCITVMGRKTDVDLVSMRVDEGDRIEIENIGLDVLYTPGHTDDSYCFLSDGALFTGDTLLIRGTGRTDFQNGDPRTAYESIFGKLLTLPDETLVYPAHDYKGETVSTIGEEKAYNPRLQVSSADQYAEIMNGLNLPDPKMMDEAVPANLSIGYHPDDPELHAHTIEAIEALRRFEEDGALFIDLREAGERTKTGVIPGSLHASYGSLEEAVRPGGLLAAVTAQSRTPPLLYCAFGERSALALRILKDAGIGAATHLAGGVEAWSKVGGPLVSPES